MRKSGNFIEILSLLLSHSTIPLVSGDTHTLNLLDAGIGARKKAGMIFEKEFTGFDDIVVGHGIVKTEDHG